MTRIVCHSEKNKGGEENKEMYCLQYDDKKIVVGARDSTIKVGFSI